MTTPIADFLDRYAKSGTVRGHMPGHKGQYPHDITEIKGADSLFEARGMIRESEANAAGIFGSAHTVYSCGGSTLCIQTMAMLLKRRGVSRLAAVRNCHRSLINACALLDMDIDWIYPEYKNSYVGGIADISRIEAALSQGAGAVWITSPDYLGNITPMDDIAGLCRRYGAILAVDNAHGAYLRFIYDDEGRPLHPLYHGADICCDSAHKTLPVLTGGAYLHTGISGRFPLVREIKDAMSIFGSSSPSYEILRSLDLCNGYLSRHSSYFAHMAEIFRKCRERLSGRFTLCGDEPGKLTVYAPDSGYTGDELADILREKHIECEYSDRTHLVLMITGLKEDDISHICDALLSVEERSPVNVPFDGIAPHEQAMSLHEALLSPAVYVPLAKAAGHISGQTVSLCPPGVAAVVPGERITGADIALMEQLGLTHISVIKP
ncbi:MAG: amino acid decarboxylase [Oscillospiraceae bacterium]|nr:amino acid decarboxylase [Oscillospiraceae bacterium]